MNPLTEQLLGIPQAIANAQKDALRAVQEQERNTERKRGYYLAKVKRANGLTRDEQQAADRVAWREAVLAALEKDEPMSSVELGRVMGTTRCCALRRLAIMEEGGYVERLGTAEKTKWMRK